MLNFSKCFDKIREIAELTANLTLVIAVAVGVTVWLRRPNQTGLLNGTSVTEAVSRNAAIGTQIVLPGVDWSPYKATLVVAISSACHFCVSSSPFYRELTHSIHPAPIVVVMPQLGKDAQAFLEAHSITPRSVVSASLASIQVNATPTLLLVSSSGIVTKEWVGELTDKQRQDVIESLDHI